MRAVIVDGDVSYPPTSGKRLRTLNLMVRLAQRHRLTYIGRCTAGAGEAEQARQYLNDLGIEAILIDDPLPRKSGPAFLGRLGANLFASDLPYSVASHQSVAMRTAVEAYAARNAVDVWQFEWLPYMETLSQAAARKVVVAHNVDTLLWQRYYETARGPHRRLFLKKQWQRMERFERSRFRRAHRVVAVSENDARIIRTEFGMPRVDVVDNGIDRAYFETVSGERQDSHILFLGALDWRPNLDAVHLLLDSIFPRVLAGETRARLQIVGRNPPPGLVQRIQATPGVDLHANVPDVRPFLGKCGVMAVPLRIGGGSRLKILEALACGLPVISTKVGAEGLDLEPGRDFVQADEPEAMAVALIKAIREPAPLREMANKSRQFVLEHYDWDVLASKLEQIWEKCQATEAVSAGT